jgi:hypothetical protein
MVKMLVRQKIVMAYGGIGKMLKALEKPRSKAAREYKEWLGYNFDPTEFDLDETRGLLAEIID